MVSSIFSNALNGIQANQRQFLNAAGNIARAGLPREGGDLHENSLETEMVTVLQSRRGFEANLQVVRAADEMLGTLIDTLA